MIALPFFCSSPRNTSDLLAGEVTFCGGDDLHHKPTGISFSASIESAYRICLWSRIANRLLLKIASFEAPSSDELYKHTYEVDWGNHIKPAGTFSVSCTLTAVEGLNSNFVTLKVKDAIADYFREHTGTRPDVATHEPDVPVHVHIHRSTAELYIDFAGTSLHRRGYRVAGGQATLKENVAAAFLVRAGWNDIASGGGALVDPMCGTGTLPIEAALISTNTAPGLFRSYFGFLGWLGRSEDLWNRAVIRAKEERRPADKKKVRIIGYDLDQNSISAAIKNIESSGLTGTVHVEKREMPLASPPAAFSANGLVIVNPPYGKRLGTADGLRNLYRTLGKTLKMQFPGWKAALLTGDEELAKCTGLRADRINTLYNGSIKCLLAQFSIRPSEPASHEPDAGQPGQPSSLKPAPQRHNESVFERYSNMFANRIRKNLKRLTKWAQSEGVSCFRLYDADMPEFAAAIDFFEWKWVHVQEYAPPHTIDPDRARRRLEVIVEALPEVLNIEKNDVFVKRRQRQRHGSQYGEIASEGVFHEVHEGGLSFLVNFADHLDTGLFLDHRVARDLVRKSSKNKRFLNLFAYTGSVTIYAADGGAISTTSVDLSNTYTEWARENMILNGFAGTNHTFIKAEVRDWLRREHGDYDLIFLDPPTYSRSKGASRAFQVQDDHVALITSSIHRLAKGGELYFSTNYKKFKLDEEKLPDVNIEDLTDKTISEDFRRNKRIHQIWRITSNDK